MKKIMISAAYIILLLFSSLQSSKSATAYVTIIVDVYTTDYKPELYVDPCWGYGNKCIVIIVITNRLESAVEHLPEGGFSLTTTFMSNSIKKYCSPVDTSSYVIYPSTGNYTFPENTSLRIDECDYFAELVGVTINISGHTTNNNGVLVSYIPEQ